MTVKDSEGNTIENVICYDKETSKLLGKTSSEFLHDRQAQELFDNATCDAQFSMELLVQKVESKYLILLLPPSPFQTLCMCN
jgi:hypothetical protein